MAEERRRKRNAQRIFLIGLFTLLVLFVFFLIDNIRNVYSHSRRIHGSPLKTKKKLRGFLPPDAQPFNHDSLASRARHLIVVAGHSVTISDNLRDAGVDENAWFLLDYQKGKGLPQAIVAHISAGIAEAERDPESLLIFSGGETRAITGPLTEASSYFRVADAMELWPDESSVRARAVTEEFATDSFENLYVERCWVVLSFLGLCVSCLLVYSLYALCVCVCVCVCVCRFCRLFSICRFKEVTGSYPNKITVVSFTFKQRRFEKLHAPALQWPSDHFSYIGVDPPVSTGFNLAQAKQGERENAALPFEHDPYGCHTPVLQEKRRERNPFARTPPYELSCPEMKALLHYCGPKPFPKWQLPWRNL